MRCSTVIVTLMLVVFASAAGADEANIATLRGEASLSDNPEPPSFPRIENKDLKRKRNYPMQAPTIPHKIDNYQVDLYSHKCMSCHSRRRTEESQAPMVSVTHYMDRDGNFLAEISPRRYFCNQCHIPQYEIGPAVENVFEDMDAIVERERRKQE